MNCVRELRQTYPSVGVYFEKENIDTLDVAGKPQINLKWMLGYDKGTDGAVLNILRNEKYVGDLEMQKTVNRDFLTHRSVKNLGEAPKYYVKSHHEGIIDRLTWLRRR